MGTTASAIIPGVAPTESASRGDWDSALQAAISGPGPNFLHLQQLIGQLQSAVPAGQPAHGLLVLDFLKLQGLVAEWVDPAPNQLIPQANHKLLELCGSVLLPAAIRMSQGAARLVTALINALLYAVADVVGTVETSMRGPRTKTGMTVIIGGAKRRGERRERGIAPLAPSSAAIGRTGAVMGVASAKVSTRKGDTPARRPRRRLTARRGSRFQHHQPQVRGPACASSFK